MKAIIVHGGAGDIKRKNEVPERIKACKVSAEKGFKTLLKGGSSIDSVVEAVKSLELHPLFDAGIGSYLNEKGFVELDAAVMDGLTLKIGAVAGLRHVKSPVELARVVMEKCKHSFLIGEGAEEFAGKMNLEMVEKNIFFLKELRRFLKINTETLSVQLHWMRTGASQLQYQREAQHLNLLEELVTLP